VPLKTMMDRIGRERGWPPLTREQYDAGRTLRGATVVGSPEQVAEKILWQHELFGHERFLIQFTVGSMPHDKTLKAIELFGTRVAPIVRGELSRRASGARASGASPLT
jgi:alkanesulfonate monooxygenase SsuD/methylene tetrahydromethanopterin reductase-like flavin-dependent oxidoreductase (luciferase family)